MLSVTELAARCQGIGGELANKALSHYELVDRATALTLILRTLEEVMEREYPVVALSMSADPVQEDIDAARAVLQVVATEATSGHREELRDRLLVAQRHLDAACQRLAA